MVAQSFTVDVLSNDPCVSIKRTATCSWYKEHFNIHIKKHSGCVQPMAVGNGVKGYFCLTVIPLQSILFLEIVQC